MMQARELCVPVSPPRRAPRPAMTDKMLLHPGDPFPALTEIDVTVIAPPADDDATTQELIASHGLRFPAGHGAGVSGIAETGAFVKARPAVPAARRLRGPARTGIQNWLIGTSSPVPKLITTDDILDPIAGAAREYATLRDRCWYASARK